jgi:hypothetical protein
MQSMSEKFDPAPHDKHAVDPETARKDDQKQSRLDKELEDTFPASDPTSETQPKPSKD